MIDRHSAVIQTMDQENSSPRCLRDRTRWLDRSISTSSQPAARASIPVVAVASQQRDSIRIGRIADNGRKSWIVLHRDQRACAAKAPPKDADRLPFNILGFDKLNRSEDVPLLARPYVQLAFAEVP